MRFLILLLLSLFLTATPALAQTPIPYPPELSNYPILRVPRALPEKINQKLKVTLLPDSDLTQYLVCVDYESTLKPCTSNLLQLMGTLVLPDLTPLPDALTFFQQTDAKYRQMAGQGQYPYPLPDQPTTVKLTNGATAYYLGFYCGIQCPPALFTWEEQGWRFTIYKPYAKIKDFLDLVNNYILDTTSAK